MLDILLDYCWAFENQWGFCGKFYRTDLKMI